MPRQNDEHEYSFDPQNEKSATHWHTSNAPAQKKTQLANNQTISNDLPIAEAPTQQTNNQQAPVANPQNTPLIQPLNSPNPLLAGFPNLGKNLKNLGGLGMGYESTCRKMQTETGVDLSRLTIIPNSAKADKAQAQALCVGDEIHFGAGFYNPNDQKSLRLFVHELTHYVQQQKNRVKETPFGQNADPRLEAEADKVAAQMEAGKNPQMGTFTSGSGKASKDIEQHKPTKARILWGQALEESADKRLFLYKVGEENVILNTQTGQVWFINNIAKNYTLSHFQSPEGFLEWSALQDADYAAIGLTAPSVSSPQIQNTENASVNAIVGSSNNTILPETQQKIELGIQNADAVEAQRLANRSTWEVVQDASADLFVSAVEMAVDIALEISPTTWVRRGWIVTKTIRALAKEGWVAAGIEAVKLVPKVGNKLSEGLYNANQEAKILEAFAQGDSEKVQALEEGKYVDKFMDKALGLAIKRLVKNKPTSNPNNTDAADNTNVQPKPTDKLDADQPHTNADELAADEALVAKLAADRAKLLANIRKALNAPNPPAPKPAKKATRNPSKNTSPTKQPILQQKPAQNPNPTQENADNQNIPKSEKVEDPAADIILTRHQKRQALRNQIGSENIDAFDVYTNTFKNKPDELDAKFLEIETALGKKQKVLLEQNGTLHTRPKMPKAIENFASLLHKGETNVATLNEAFVEAKKIDPTLADALYNNVFKSGSSFEPKNNTNKNKDVFNTLKKKGDAGEVAAAKAMSELREEETPDGLMLYLPGYGDMPIGAASLDGSGYLSLYIITDGTPLKGGQVFDKLMAYEKFAGKITAIKTDWNKSSGMSSNFDQYQKNLAAGMKEQQAAINTFSGEMAKRHGYVNVELIPPAKGEEGQRVQFLFTK